LAHRFYRTFGRNERQQQLENWVKLENLATTAAKTHPSISAAKNQMFILFQNQKFSNFVAKLKADTAGHEIKSK